jgi:hypothetical protein
MPGGRGRGAAGGWGVGGAHCGGGGGDAARRRGPHRWAPSRRGRGCGRRSRGGAGPHLISHCGPPPSLTDDHVDAAERGEHEVGADPVKAHDLGGEGGGARLGVPVGGVAAGVSWGAAGRLQRRQGAERAQPCGRRQSPGGPSAGRRPLACGARTGTHHERDGEGDDNHDALPAGGGRGGLGEARGRGERGPGGAAAPRRGARARASRRAAGSPARGPPKKTPGQNKTRPTHHPIEIEPRPSPILDLPAALAVALAAPSAAPAVALAAAFAAAAAALALAAAMARAALANWSSSDMVGGWGDAGVQGRLELSDGLERRVGGSLAPDRGGRRRAGEAHGHQAGAARRAAPATPEACWPSPASSWSRPRRGGRAPGAGDTRTRHPMATWGSRSPRALGSRSPPSQALLRGLETPGGPGGPLGGGARPKWGRAGAREGGVREQAARVDDTGYKIVAETRTRPPP